MGDESCGGRGDAALTPGDLRHASDAAAAYDAAAMDWAAGPAPLVYRALAEALVARAGLPLAGCRVLDLGAGTGLAGHAAAAAGAVQVAAVDVAAALLGQCPAPVRPVVADAARLPFSDASFDVILAAFSLSYLDDLLAGLREARRVGAALAASAFAPGWTHPAKTAVERALVPFGYQPPPWYEKFKSLTEPRSKDPELLTALAVAAGFSGVAVRAVHVATGVSGPEQLASWRLGMAHVSPFLGTLEPRQRAAARREAERAVAGSPPLAVSMLVLTGN